MRPPSYVLDITLFKEASKLSATVYTKSIDRNTQSQEVSPSNFEGKFSIQLARWQKVCSSDDIFKAKCWTLREIYNERKY